MLTQQHEGDGMITARITSIDQGSPRAMAGIMFRESTDRESRSIAIGIQPSGELILTWRDKPDDEGPEKKLEEFPLPIHLKLTRRGDTYEAHTSADGVAWGAPLGKHISATHLPAQKAGLRVTANLTRPPAPLSLRKSASQNRERSIGSHSMKTLLLLLLSVFATARGLRGAEPPQFIVPGQEVEMQALNDLHALHHANAFTNCTLWDTWLPLATLWTGKAPQERYRQVFAERRIDEEGYVSMQQHRGLGHSEGWPFPTWQQAGGAGFHFSTHDEVYALQYFALKALTNTDGWEISGAEVGGIDPVRGLQLRGTGDVIHITTPPFRCGTIVAPFVRIEWGAQGLPAEAKAKLTWQMEGETAWDEQRSVPVTLPRAEDGVRYANVPMYRHRGYAGVLTRYRLTVEHAAGAKVELKSLITAIDTRHPITNFHFIRGSADYFGWTQDLPFLRENIVRMRRALRFALGEFRVREDHCVTVPWVGHDGRSGLVVAPDGKKTIRPGLGVGGNYFDLLPFGGSDGAATIHLYDALRHFIALERVIAANPAWAITPEGAFAADELATLADPIQKKFQQQFWNAETQRFVGWIDSEGHSHDYGFTFHNLQAIHYGLASPEQARSILAWLDGWREVSGDTSRGADIYQWRFGPRLTTRRNVETYQWVWSSPETIPWGDQVQDGGAVLGFSYYDLMTRLKVRGPDDAWQRLGEILRWFREVQSEGGYRTYYGKPGRGTLQGGGPAGGLGLDQEFMESVLVPQVMLYGFLGLTPETTGFAIAPRLPKGWPSLTVSRVRLHDHEVEVTAEASGRVTLKTLVRGTGTVPLRKGTAELKLEPAGPGTLTELR